MPEMDHRPTQVFIGQVERLLWVGVLTGCVVVGAEGTGVPGVREARPAAGDAVTWAPGLTVLQAASSKNNATAETSQQFILCTEWEE